MMKMSFVTVCLHVLTSHEGEGLCSLVILLLLLLLCLHSFL